MDSGRELPEGKQLDFINLRNTFHAVVASHYPAMSGRLQFRLVSCPFICAEALHLLSSLDPANFNHATSTLSANKDKQLQVHEHFPVAAVPLFATNSKLYEQQLARTVEKLNKVYREFLTSADGRGFVGQVSEAVLSKQYNSCSDGLSFCLRLGVHHWRWCWFNTCLRFALCQGHKQKQH